MADILMTGLNPSRAGTVAVAATALVRGNRKVGVLMADEYHIQNSGRVYIRISDSAAAAVMTIATHYSRAGIELPDDTPLNVAVGAREWFGPYSDLEVFNDGNGQLVLTFAANDVDLVIEVVAF
jgi:hypothetical protein